MISKKMLKFLPDPIYLRILYFMQHNRFLSISNPKTFSEKIYCRMIEPQEHFHILADKFLVRDYVKNLIGEEYLVPLYASCESVTKLIYDSLPDSFVMKSNHSAGHVIIVRRKSDYPLEVLAGIGEQWLKEDFSKYNREAHYRSIKRMIIFEEVLGNGVEPPDDYKVNVFPHARNGQGYSFIQHMTGRDSELRQTILTQDWVVADFQRTGFHLSEPIPDKPHVLNLLLELSRILCGDLSYMRVDFYIVQDRIYFGELTLTPGAGSYRFTKDNTDIELGGYFLWPEMQLAIAK